jgi:uncharacterized protein (DUF1697 family)
MEDLAGMFAAAGCADVVTFIQRKCRVPRVPAALPVRFRTVERVLLHHVGAEIPVVVRSARELAAICRANPFSRRASRRRRCTSRS